jgi:hypothetical protein
MAAERYNGDDVQDLGRCCACGREGRTVRNVLMLPVKGPEPGTGWGCCACGLPPDGAVAVLCDRCVRRGKRPIDVVAGYTAERRRVARSALAGEPHEHDHAKHAEDLRRAGGAGVRHG